MATHSSILAWRIPWTEESGRLSSRGRKESDTTERLSTHQKATKESSWPGGDTLCPRSGVVAERSYPASEVSVSRGGQEKPPRAWGQGWWRWGATPSPRPGAAPGRSHPCPRPGPAAGRSNPRSGGCAGTGGPRGAIPRWRSGTAEVRRYALSKVRNSGGALLEQPWRDTPHPR